MEDQTNSDNQASSRSKPIKIAIWGGCVCRDTVEFADKGSYELRRYIARHSLVSDGSDARTNVPEIEIESKFLKRLLNFDVRGESSHELAAKEPLDLLVLDLNIERKGFIVFDDGSMVTNSKELRAAPGIQTILDSGKYVEFKSWQHRRMWKRAAKDLIERLSDSGLLKKTVALQVDWAHIDIHGKKTRRLDGMDAAEANRRLRYYYDNLERLGVKVIRLSGFRSDPGHKWGRAPFHYEKIAYQEIDAALKAEVRNLDFKTAPHEAPSVAYDV